MSSAVVADLLAKHEGNACMAYIEALRDLNNGPEIAIEIVNHPSYGLEQKANLQDGGMKRRDGNRILCSNGGATPLILAVIADRMDVIEQLLASGANVNAIVDVENYTALHLASHAASELLIQLGVDLDAQEYAGNTPLHDACAAANIEAIAMLVAEGADLAIENHQGYTPCDSFDASWTIGELTEDEEENTRRLLTQSHSA